MYKRVVNMNRNAGIIGSDVTAALQRFA